MRIFAGRVAYIVLYPLLVVYLRGTDRSRVVVRTSDHVLLVRPWYGNGTWDVPGGGSKPNETIESAGVRELAEETGIVVGLQELKSLGPRRIRHGLIDFTAHYLICQLKDMPKVKIDGFELGDGRWVAIADLPTYRLSPDTSAVLSECL